MLTSQERLTVLLRQAERERLSLQTLRESAAQYQGQRDFPALVQIAEEQLASAEALLLLMQEREVAWMNSNQPIALAHALKHLPHTSDVLESSNACERKT